MTDTAARNCVLKRNGKLLCPVPFYTASLLQNSRLQSRKHNEGVDGHEREPKDTKGDVLRNNGIVFHGLYYNIITNYFNYSD